MFVEFLKKNKTVIYSVVFSTAIYMLIRYYREDVYSSVDIIFFPIQVYVIIYFVKKYQRE